MKSSPTNHMTDPPSGTVTFLFTDIEGSTKLAQEYSSHMPALLARHHEILNQAIQAHNGYRFRVVGDAFSVAFHNAGDALNAVLAAQRKLQGESWSPAPIKVRMGIHTGAADWKGKDHEPEYEGYTTLALTQRIMSAGHGGQILLSQTTQDLLKDVLPHGTELRDMGEHCLKDFLHAERIYQVVSADLPSEFLPLKSLETRKHNLPSQLTSFVGREYEIHEARKTLPRTRMLTFIGSGGTGKTRLSLQLAEEQLSSFSDGAWLIELAPLADAAFILSTIATTFYLREIQGLPLIDTITDYLRGKQLLLILDNCEHLVEPCAELADHFLHACPELKIIASSREALGINGETVFRVPSLKEDESIQLFVERATKSEPRFKLTEDNASSVAQICCRLDGIPLAIELAAARVKIFTPEQIAARLDDRFQLLTGGSRTALPRQQTLRALIDWSYHTLNEMEQRALCHLAVFLGGWTFEAAEAVIGPNEAMDGLLGLVNKSLVNVEEQGGKSRYSFLETIRQYAMDRLLESGQTVHARNRHLNYFLGFAEREGEQLFDTEGGNRLTQFELEHDNLRFALRWALDNDPLMALKLVRFMNEFWLRRGYLVEGRQWCTAALEGAEKLSLDNDDDIEIQAHGFHVLAMLTNNQGEHRLAREAVEKAIPIYRKLGDSKSLARSLVVHGTASAFSGDLNVASTSIQESVNICRQLGYKWELAWGLSALAGLTIQTQGRAAEKEIDAYLEESLAAAQESGDPSTYVYLRELLARQAFQRGDIAEARRYAEDVLTHRYKTGDTLAYNGYKSGIAHALREIGSLEEALALYRETIIAWQKIGHRGAIAHQLECFAFIAKAQEQGERATKLLGAAEVLREVCGALMTPQERIHYDEEVAGLHAGMDEIIFESLWKEGRSLTIEQAIQLALS